MGKLQPFKALGSVVKAAAPFASFIPGVSPLAGAGIGFLGSMLGGGGGGGGNRGPNTYSNEQMALINQILPLMRDPGIAAQQFDRDVFGQAHRSGAQLGGLVADQTGNPGAEAAIMLGQMNRATEASNQFKMDAFSPAGRARAAQGILPFYQGLANQSLNRYQIGQQYQRPTFGESLFGAASNVLPFYLNQQRNQPTTQQRQIGNNVGNQNWAGMIGL